MLRVLKAGLQSTLQGAPRLGHRHLGIPYAGPADPLSMALANRLVGNDRDATCLEITFETNRCPAAPVTATLQSASASASNP
ncbi:MAG: allophanate hydrolase subunit 2 family protein, partial [Pseudomonadota bacterium]